MNPIRLSYSWSEAIRPWVRRRSQTGQRIGSSSLDINMGCPVRKIVNNKSGSYLMQDMPLAAEIIKNVVKATPFESQR